MLNILLPKNVLSISLFSFSYSSPSNSIAFNHYKLPHSFQSHSKNKCSPSFYPILYLVSILLLLVSLYYFVILRYSGFLPFLTVQKRDRISVNILPLLCLLQLLSLCTFNTRLSSLLSENRSACREHHCSCCHRCRREREYICRIACLHRFCR